MTQTQTEITLSPLRQYKPAQWERVLEKERPKGQTGRILQVFMNADLRSQHTGLEKLAKDNGINVHNLQPGQFVVFINTHKDKIKVYAASQVIAYCRLDKGRRVDMNVIREIPRVFLASGRLDYEAALKDAVEQALARNANRVPIGSPTQAKA